MGENSLAVAGLRLAQAEGAQVVDVRMPVRYVREHIPESINIPYARQGFKEQSAYFLRRERPVVVVADSPQFADLAAQDLRSLGFSVQGVLQGGISAWTQSGEPTAAVDEITAGELEDLMQEGGVPLLVDVREAWEFQAGHIDGAMLMPISQFVERYPELPKDRPAVFVCASGSRSGEAVQFLYRLGYRRVYNLQGGMAAWRSGRRRA